MFQWKLHKRFWLTIVLLLLNNIIFCQIYSYKNYTNKDGLPLNDVSSIFTKSDGGILIGTNGAGISEFDGYKFQDVIDQDHHHITAIKQVKDEIIFLSKFKGLYKIDKQGNYQLLNSLNHQGELLELSITNDQVLIFSPFSILSYNLSSKKTIQLRNFKTKNLEVSQIIKNDKETIILTNNGNYAYKDDQLIPLSDLISFSKKELLDNSMYGYAKNGIIYLFDEQFNDVLIINTNENNYHVSTKKVTKNQTDKQLNVCATVYNKVKDCFSICSTNGNIYEEKGLKIEKIRRNSYIDDISVKKFTHDYYGDYWLATNNYGIIKVSTEPFTRLYYQKRIQ